MFPELLMLKTTWEATVLKNSLLPLELPSSVQLPLCTTRGIHVKKYNCLPLEPPQELLYRVTQYLSPCD